jgi:hypothetical protein
MTAIYHYVIEDGGGGDGAKARRRDLRSLAKSPCTDSSPLGSSTYMTSISMFSAARLGQQILYFSRGARLTARVGIEQLVDPQPSPSTGSPFPVSDWLHTLTGSWMVTFSPLILTFV